MPDPGFNWYVQFMKEAVSRLPAACILEEAGRLLNAASLLWPGRIRAKEINALGYKLQDTGSHWRKNAICFSDHPWTNGRDSLRSAGFLLDDFRYDGKYCKPREINGPNCEAARLLVRSAFDLVYLAVPIVRQTGDEKRDREADALEDLLEIPEEAPYVLSGPQTTPERNLDLLVRRSLAVFNSGLALSVDIMHAYRGGILKEPKPAGRQAAVAKWEAISAHWHTRAEADFTAFTQLASPDDAMRTALLDVADRARSYIPWSRNHYTDDETMERVETVAQALAAALWSLTTGREPEAGLCDLPPQLTSPDSCQNAKPRLGEDKT